MPSSWPHVDKSAPARELFTAIRRVAAGQSWLPPAIPELLAVARASIHAEDRAIFDLLVRRTPPAQIAASLRLSRPQLETQRDRMLERVAVRVAVEPAFGDEPR